MNHSAIIDRLGGTTVVAKMCEVRHQAVSQWRKKGIPRSRLQYLRLARPDVFEDSEPQTYVSVDEGGEGDAAASPESLAQCKEQAMSDGVDSILFGGGAE